MNTLFVTNYLSVRTIIREDIICGMQGTEKLINRAKRGDKDAFGKIYEIFVKKIYRFIYYMVYDRELAEDLTQLVFLKAWRSLPSYLPTKGTCEAYIYAIASHQVIEYQRRKKELSLDQIEEPALSFDIDDPIIQEENKGTVRNLLSTIGSDERQLIIWRYFEELQFTEIAQILNEKEGAIRVRLHRLLKKLREKMEKKQNGY